MKNNKKKCQKDFGSRNVAGFEGIDKLFYDVPFRDAFHIKDIFKNFINKIQTKIDKEEQHLANNQELIKRAYWTEGYYNGRIAAFEDCLDILINVVNKNEQIQD